MKASVIIPVYNAERKLPKCLASLKAQTYPDVECCFVDDCSTDGSLALIESFARDSGREVVICRHDVNKGVAAARNTALDAISGDVVCWVDADDWLEPTAIEKGVAAIESGNTDIVGWEWMLSFNQNERYMKQAPFATPVEALKNMMTGVMRWNLWLFMARRSLYEENSARFTPTMDMGEDLALMMRLFLHAKEVKLLPEPLYHYAQTEASVSNGFTEKTIRQVTFNVGVVERAVSESAFAADLIPCMAFLKLNIKLPLLISDNKQNYAQWSSWFLEANPYIMQNKALPLRTRLLQWSASHKQWWLVRLYYRLVYKLVYGVIYK